ncbi:MAG: hypothetical protein IJH12_09560 [Clostridia bacterium]|nr:hypothetical protein [Clostridia bacterium]
MVWIKFIMLISIFGTISKIGVKVANKYEVRADNLRKIKKALKILEAKITYTYEMLPDLFFEIADKIKGEVRRII